MRSMWTTYMTVPLSTKVSAFIQSSALIMCTIHYNYVHYLYYLVDVKYRIVYDILFQIGVLHQFYISICRRLNLMLKLFERSWI